MNQTKATSGGGLLLVLLMLIYAVNQLDRNILSIALPGIRAKFHLGDGALGLLTGPAFALVYVLLGIPLAVLADRGRTRMVIAGSLAVFSVMTMACGAAGNFGQLLAARMGVGVGEAGTAPALNAVIARRFDAGKRSGALSVCSAGANLGLLLAFFGGGLIMQRWGWRTALVAAGAPGLLLMLLFLAGYREMEPVAPLARAPLRQTVRFLRAQPGFLLLALGSGLASIGGYAALAFVPSVLSRSHHMTPAQIGLVLALLVGVGGFFGTMLPGLLADRFRQNGLHVAMIVVLAWMPSHLLLCLAGDARLMLPGLALAAFFVSAWLGPVLAAAQAIAPDRMRAQTAALLLAALNLIGMAAGPPLVGFASDLLRPALGEEALRYALAGAAAPAPLAAWCFAAAPPSRGKHLCLKRQ
jgi:predicted MFS family arabinose efflux permease